MINVTTEEKVNKLVDDGFNITMNKNRLSFSTKYLLNDNPVTVKVIDILYIEQMKRNARRVK